MPLTPEISAALHRASTATITTVLLKKGIRRSWMRGPMPLADAAGKRVVGPAFTLRFVPAREDLATPESWSSPKSTRAAIEAMPEGVVAVVDALGVTRRRHFRRHPLARACASAASPRSSPMASCAISPAWLATGLPVWCAGAAAPASVAAPHLRRLAGADRLRRRCDLSR